MWRNDDELLFLLKKKKKKKKEGLNGNAGNSNTPACVGVLLILNLTLEVPHTKHTWW